MATSRIASSRDQAAVADRVVQAAAVHELREDAGHALDAAHVVAGDGVRVEAEVHPGLGLALEVFGAARAPPAPCASGAFTARSTSQPRWRTR